MLLVIHSNIERDRGKEGREKKHTYSDLQGEEKKRKYNEMSLWQL